MKIDLKNIVSMSEANQNFSKIAKLVDEAGCAVILKNNKPRYIMLNYDDVAEFESTNEAVRGVAQNILARNLEAFKELAK